jgi:hypothetical protein
LGLLAPLVTSVIGRVALIALLAAIVGVALPRGASVGVASSSEIQSARAAAAPRRGGAGREPGTPSEARTLVRAKVTAVDGQTGRVDMTADGLTLAATFPPAVVAELQPGHIVFVTIDVIDARLATVAGSISAVDEAKGTAAVTTPGGTLTLAPSGRALSGMKLGDEVLLKLSLVDIGPEP